MPGAWKLIIEDDAGKQIVVPFTRDVITIGRREGNTIRLTERNVSRDHAKLSKDNGHVLLEDLKSFNGIKLNGDRIEGRVVINEGDTIQIGDYHLAIHAQDGVVTASQGAQNGQGGAPMRSAAVANTAQRDDDEFAGDTQRWEPPAGMPGIAVGGVATVEDRAVSDEHTAPAPIVTVRTAERPVSPPAAISGEFGTDNGDTERVTMDMLDSMGLDSMKAGAPSLPLRSREGDLEPTVKQPASPNPISMPPQNMMPPPSMLARDGNGHGGAETVPQARAEGPMGPGSLSKHPTGPHPPSHSPPVSPPRTPALEARRVQDEHTEALRQAPIPDELALPRLVVLNTIFAGSTFSLRAAEAVIGRTEDNDITIEHRSVSRNHAKVVREGDRVRILDLKSANGVLVNNEEVEQAVLRSGDVVELGRVRMRFVPIGERFVVAPDEIEKARIADAVGDDFESDGHTGVTNPVRKKQPGFGVDMLTGSGEGASKPKVLYVALGGFVVLAIVAGILIARSGGDEEDIDKPVVGDSTPPPPPDSALAVAPPSTAPVDPLPPSVADSVAVAASAAVDVAPSAEVQPPPSAELIADATPPPSVADDPPPPDKPIRTTQPKVTPRVKKKLDIPKALRDNGDALRERKFEEVVRTAREVLDDREATEAQRQTAKIQKSAACGQAPATKGCK